MRTREGERAGSLWLLVFGALFGLLVLALAVMVGVGSPHLPAGAVAVIEEAPPGTGTITEVELREAIDRQADLLETEGPRPGSEEYAVAQQQALSELIIVTWLAGQAMELGLQVGKSQEQLNLRVLQEKVMAALAKEAPDPSNPQPYFTAIDFEFPGKWLPRTFCRNGFIVQQCGNFVSGHIVAPCYEADPEESFLGCPAPVAQRVPARPGSVTERQPWGVAWPQRPYPG